MPKQSQYVRQVLTVYYEDFKGHKPVKRTRSSHANTATAACFNHMQLNHYGAVLAEVHDERDGVLHAVFKRSVNGDVHALFQREVKEGM